MLSAPDERSKNKRPLLAGVSSDSRNKRSKTGVGLSQGTVPIQSSVNTTNEPGPTAQQNQGMGEVWFKSVCWLGHVLSVCWLGHECVLVGSCVECVLVGS